MSHFLQTDDGARAERAALKRASRGDAILARAVELVAAEGLDKLTLQRLGAAMGIVPAALYRYFPSKDALVAALQRRAVGATHAAFTEARSARLPSFAALRPEVAALAEVLATARFYLELPRTHPDEWLLVATLLGDPRPLLSDEESLRTAPLLAAFITDVRALVATAAATGAIAKGDATSRTMVLWAALHGALSLDKARRIAPELPAPEQVGMDAAEALAIGWGASADVLAKAARAAGSTMTTKPQKTTNGTTKTSTKRTVTR